VEHKFEHRDSLRNQSAEITELIAAQPIERMALGDVVGDVG
jgi:hypothetical protein